MKTITLLKSAFFLLTLLLVGCSKSNFLNQKPDKSLLIPNTLEHFQAILDSDHVMNGAADQGITPQLGESGGDNFYLLDEEFNTFIRPQMQNYYLWSEYPYEGGVNVADYTNPYEAILYANTVLDGIDGIEPTEQNKVQYDNIIGQAHFHRAHMFYHLAQVFAPAYNPETDNLELGIFLRLSADINELLHRATVQETYNQIIDDLSTSIKLLDNAPLYKTRPSKQAAYGLLARTHLAMRQYDTAKAYADSCLEIQNGIYDYNLLDTLANSAFQSNTNTHPINEEIIFYSAMLSSISQRYPTSFQYAIVDSNLYSSYHINDLRRVVFFGQLRGENVFKGSYSYRGRVHYFSGLAVDEIILIRAECNARLGNVDASLDDLNRLLFARWKDDVTFEPYEGLNDQEALSVILIERRKELLFRGLRWTDLRRLNQEGHNITITRHMNGQLYTLTPNDPRWTWPLPLEVIAQ